MVSLVSCNAQVNARTLGPVSAIIGSREANNNREGIITMVVAIIAYFVMQDYPSTAKFLTEEERTEVTRRLVHDRSSLADEFDMKYFKDAMKDWKIWVHMFITIGSVLTFLSLPEPQLNPLPDATLPFTRSPSSFPQSSRPSVTPTIPLN